MNREIEFRAWLKDEKKMYGVSELQLSSESAMCCNLGTKDRPYFYVDLKEIELMQYTGLKDKNGVKIFEGDIVKCKIGNVDFEGYVYFYGGRFEFIDFEDDEETEFLCYCDELEIIGNIYENPKLLEVQDE